MDPKTLIDLILTMPGNATATDQAVLDWLNQTVTVQGDATNGDVLSWAAGNDAIARLTTESNGQNATTRGLADAALARVRAGLGLNLSDAGVQGLLSALVTTGVFTQPEVDALNATAQTQVARWDEKPLTLEGKPCRAMTLDMVVRGRI